MVVKKEHHRLVVLIVYFSLSEVLALTGSFVR